MCVFQGSLSPTSEEFYSPTSEEFTTCMKFENPHIGARNGEENLWAPILAATSYLVSHPAKSGLPEWIIGLLVFWSFKLIFRRRLPEGNHGCLWWVMVVSATCFRNQACICKLIDVTDEQIWMPLEWRLQTCAHPNHPIPCLYINETGQPTIGNLSRSEIGEPMGEPRWQSDGTACDPWEL